MTYVNARKYLAAHRGIQSSPERMKLLCRYLDDRVRFKKCIHIAGGSGKTSCALMLSSILGAAGLKTGVFSRPFASEERESVSVCGHIISCNEFADFTGKVAKAAKSMTADILAARGEIASENARNSKITKNLLEGKISPEPSFDEILCAVALVCFTERACDITILECGDSRADPTGVIEPPSVSVICGGILTQEQLRTGIGIIRRGTREVVSSVSPGEAYSAVLNTCVRMGSRLTVPARAELSLIRRNLGGRDFEYRGKEYHLPLCPEYQAQNSLTAIEAAYALRRTGVPIDSDAIVRGLSEAKVPLRFELISLSPFIAADCPATAGDAATFCESLKELSGCFGKNSLLVTPEGESSPVSEDMLSECGIAIKKILHPITEKDMRETAIAAASLSENESMLILGDIGFTGRLTYSIRKHLGIG